MSDVVSLRARQGGFGVTSLSVQPSTISSTARPNCSRISARTPYAERHRSVLDRSWSNAPIASSSLAPKSNAIAVTPSRWAT